MPHSAGPPSTVNVGSRDQIKEGISTNSGYVVIHFDLAARDSVASIDERWFARNEMEVPVKEHEIQWAVDELEIRNVIASLALLSDMGDIEEWGMLFTEDADYTTASGAGWHGRAEIVESGRQRRARGTHGPGSSNRHLSASVVVRSTGPDTAEAESYLAMFKDLVPEGDDHLPEGAGNDGQAEKSPTLLVLGYYRDRFRRTSDGWKVAHRELAQSSHTPQWRAIMQSRGG